jgi:hypothetical protein
MTTPAKTPVRRVFTDDRTTDEAQRTAQDLGRKINAHPFMGGVLIDAEAGKPAGTGLSFTTGAVRTIAHGLGRKAIGLVEVYGVDVPSPAPPVGLVSTAQPTGVSSATHVTVTPTNTGTCFLFVF